MKKLISLFISIILSLYIWFSFSRAFMRFCEINELIRNESIAATIRNIPLIMVFGVLVSMSVNFIIEGISAWLELKKSRRRG